MITLKEYLLYIAKKCMSSSKRINDLLTSEPELSFDVRNGTFSVINRDLTPYERADIRRTLMGKLRNIKPLVSVKIDDVQTGYYDQCLERYLYEKINCNKPNEETCWFKYAQNNKCIGWVHPNIHFDSEAKKNFLRKLGEQKSKFKNDQLVDYMEKDSNGYIFLRSQIIKNNDDKVLSTYNTIEKNGFNNILSSFTPIILGYSLVTGKYNVISGRHRIATLRYLRTQGKVNGSFKIKCHIVKYPYDNLVFTRPYKDKCNQCDWGGIFDPGSGSHQDFFVREGIAVIRGGNKQKGGRQKWDRISPIFKEAVLNKTVLDIGAYRGLFCLKALEYGAKKATAFEKSADLAEVVARIKERYMLNDLILIKGDFYDNSDYKLLKDAKYETVFLFGVIHHLLRLGIQKKALYSFDELFQRIAEIASYGVIVEFAMPKEESLNLPELSPYRNEFSQKPFETAMKKYFSNFRNLGVCNYRSGNRHGRFMYYGTRQ
ncbi:MAG: class I SAM-dependent methyltransferase [Candidatus Brocadiaceae bacterium]|nr:class I SAM-dependent methyltransferase [Candidatus Brocadiaceae bacterium]